MIKKIKEILNRWGIVNYLNLDLFLIKKILRSSKIGTLRNVWIHIEVPKIDGEPFSKDKIKQNEQRFKIFKLLCNSLPEELKITEINLYWESLEHSNKHGLNMILSKNSNKEYIKEAERIMKELKKKNIIILPYCAFIQIDGCDLYNILLVCIYSNTVEVKLCMEKLNLFQRRKLKPGHVKILYKFLKEFIKKVGGRISYTDWEDNRKWEENMDIYEDHFRKDLSPRSLKLLEEGKIERFIWNLYLTRFDGKEVDLTHWRYGKLKKGDYEPLKRTIKFVLENLPKEFKIEKIWVDIEKLNEYDFEGGSTREGVILKKPREEYYDSIVEVISKTKAPLRVKGISIYLIIDGIENTFRIDIRVSHRNMSRKFLVVCSMIMNIFSRKDVKKEHIIKIDKFVRKLLRKNPNLELDYVYYEEKGWASY